jgi:hypothetical protein
MRRILSALAGAFRDLPADAPVHFHQGPTGQAAACYDTGCRNPRLHVR